MTKPSLKDAQATLRQHAPDMTMRKDASGEYRVTFTQEAIARAYPAMTRAERIEKAESLAGYESDICDAYETAKAMHRVGLAVGPAKPASAPLDPIETIRAAIGSLAYACGALDAPTFSTMRANLADLEAMLSDMLNKGGK